MSLVIDLRCLQDVNHYERGIGQHTRNLVRHARGRFTGLIDSALPPLPDEVAALVPELSPHAYIPGARLFLNPSPFIPNQVFLARLLTDPAVRKAACVYDFIPFDDQANYLADAATRLDYFTAMAWLKRYDVFLPISEPTKTQLTELYGDVRAVVTGVALPGRVSEEAVAGKVFSALVPKPAVARGAKPRIAMLTPMPPEKTGIAKYSAACARELRKLAELEVFAGDAVSALTYANGKYDAVLSVIGNSPLHERIYDCTLRWGGAALCHDARLMGLLGRRAAPLASSELGRTVTEREISAWAADEATRQACFLGELAAVARPLIFHTRHSVAEVRERFGVDARYLPFAMQRLFPPMEKQAARAALGISPEQKLIVSFGFVIRGKGIPAALAALSMLRDRVDARLVFVGEDASHGENFRTLAEDLGVADAVQLGTGFLPETQYRLWLAAADAGLQLRQGQPGNISAALQDCIGAGLPTVATADLAENLSAPGYVKRVCDVLDAREIATALEEVLTASISTEEERRAYCTAHSMAPYAATLLQLLQP
jgi:glycosyltransferase involved in cell wall biosynthesis